ncbi:MAG TPA: SCP2 sterol-binding domain-containing protein [Bacillales bacterium]|nr:SCP2 sterol-binding domain-containing protein [Bacillales bacterium]
MAYSLLSKQWVEQFAAEVKKGPTAERTKAVDPNYWEWIEKVKQQMDIRLALVLKDDRENRFAYLDFEKGELINYHIGTQDEQASADFVLSGSLDDWQEVITGPRQLTQNLMYRKLRLTQGNLHSYFRGIYFFVELLRSGLRTPTSFESKPAVKG